jgi:hypothetical protein
VVPDHSPVIKLSGIERLGGPLCGIAAALQSVARHVSGFMPAKSGRQGASPPPWRLVVPDLKAT